MSLYFFSCVTNAVPTAVLLFLCCSQNILGPVLVFIVHQSPFHAHEAGAQSRHKLFCVLVCCPFVSLQMDTTKNDLLSKKILHLVSEDESVHNKASQCLVETP